MTPEEHYERGLELLSSAERAEGDGAWTIAHTHAALAQAQFAAAAGTGMRAMETLVPVERNVVGQPEREFKPGDRVVYVLRQFDQEPRRLAGRVAEVAADGFVTADVAQPGSDQPMTVIAPEQAFVAVTVEPGPDGVA